MESPFNIMAANLSTTLAPGATSSEVATTPGTIMTVQASRDRVIVESKISQGSERWISIGSTRSDLQALVIIATSETIRLRNANPAAADCEVYTES